MSRFEKGQKFHRDQPPKLGVLLVNLGSPDAPSASAVKRYLREFLWDPRVVEIPRIPWWLILNGIILNVRPKKSAELYKTIWLDEGPPLVVHSRRQQEKIAAYFDQAYPGKVEVALGMRYGNPSIESALKQLDQAGAERIVVLPLYPQYSAATTGTVFDKVTTILSKQRWVPELRFISQYHAQPAYIDAMAKHIQQYWSQHGRAKKIMLSFHGLPQRCVNAGDPYFQQCQQTAQLLVNALALHDEEWLITFQSRFGREEWLQPYTDKTLESLPSQGIKSVDVFCPGFSADCLETLEEIAITNQEGFVAAGGEVLNYIPALNAIDSHIDCLTELIQNHSSGWPELQ